MAFTLYSAPAKNVDVPVRVVKANDGASVFQNVYNGVNCQDYDFLRLFVVPYTANPTANDAAVPGGAANPTLTVMVWCEAAQTFVQFGTNLTKTGVGAGLPYSLDVPNAKGSIILPAISALTGVCVVSACGFNQVQI